MEIRSRLENTGIYGVTRRVVSSPLGQTSSDFQQSKHVRYAREPTGGYGLRLLINDLSPRSRYQKAQSSVQRVRCTLLSCRNGLALLPQQQVGVSVLYFLRVVLQTENIPESTKLCFIIYSAIRIPETYPRGRFYLRKEAVFHVPTSTLEW